MPGIESWWSGGTHVRVRIGAEQRSIFLRRLDAREDGNGDGARGAASATGAVMTLLHGFPSSSHDWAKVAPLLTRDRGLLAFDFLGFGASEKPRPHEYSLLEQADLVEQVWAHEEIASTVLVGHDYAVSVVQELLARRREGRLAVELVAVHLLNGGLYPDLHRPQPTQTALLDPERGPQLSELLNEELFRAGLAPTFAEQFDADADCSDIWKATSREEGHRISHLLIRYMSDRERHARRWTEALEQTDVPLAFVWGMLDPISGAHMAERIRERLPAAPILELADVAHWPQLEAPERVARALLATR